MDFTKGRRNNNVLDTIFILCIVLLQALSSESLYSILTDLSETYETSVSNVATGISIRSIGICLGSVSGTFTLSGNRKILRCSLFAIIEAVCIICFARCPSLVAFYLTCLIMGLSTGTLLTGTLLVMSDLWREKSSPFIQSLDFVEYISGILAPLLIEPFLSTEVTLDNPGYEEFSFANRTTTTTTECCSPSLVQVPLTYIGSSLAIVALFAATVHLKQTDHSLKDEKRMNNVTTCAEYHNNRTISKHKLSAIYSKLIVTLACFIYMIPQMVHNCFSTYWVTFVTNLPNKVPKAQGVLMMSAFSAMATVASFLGIFLLHRLSPLKNVLIMVSTLAIGVILLYIYGNTSELMLWICGGLIHCSEACYFTAVFNIIGERTKVTEFASSLYVFFGFIPAASGVPIVVGRYLEEYPMLLCYIGFAALAAVLPLIALIAALDHYLNKKLPRVAVEPLDIKFVATFNGC